MLMNLLMPLCLRVGSGRKDVPRMRQSDISFALTVVLHAMSPPASKTAPVTAQNIKTASEMRAGSLTFSGRNNKKPMQISISLYQVAFLALKVMMICFESELVADWPRIARTIQELGKRNETGPVFWIFIDFVVTQRTPLFVLLQPFILKKLNLPSASDHERHLMFVIREKLRGFSLPTAKGRGSLLMDLAHEMKELKEELEDRRYDEQRDSKRPTLVTDTQTQSQTQTTQQAPQPQPASEPVVQPRHGRPSLIDLLSGELGSRRGSSSINTGDSHTSSQPAAHRGETSTTPLSPSSPAEDSSGEISGRPDKPRLQRSKAQSRKTFRLRKSRKSHIEVSHIKLEPQELPRVSSQTQPSAQQPVLELSVTGIPSTGVQGMRARRLSTRQTRSAENGRTHDLSWDEVSQTSTSTSGYRESYSMLMMTLESPPTPNVGAQGPPLASPDVHDLPSTSSAATNYIAAEGSSPDSSMNSTGGEDTALLCRSDRTSSQHSLLMVFETQDEDTLI